MDTDAYSKQLSKTSHDLRNALSIIYSYAQILELSLQSPEQKELHESAQALLKSIQDMEALLTQHIEKLKSDLV